MLQRLLPAPLIAAKRVATLCVLTALVLTAQGFSRTGPALAATASPTPSASTPAKSGAAVAKRATFGLKPATPGHPDDRLNFNYRIAPGGTYRDVVEVDNYGAAAITLSMIAADLGNATNGDITVGLSKDRPVDVGAWVTLPANAAAVTVAAAKPSGPGTVQLPFLVTVPGNASPGDHSGAIVAVLSTLGRNAKGQNVRLDQRIAGRIYLRVPGPLHPRITVDQLKVAYSTVLNPIGQATARVSYTVHNLGNTRLGADAAVTVNGWFGTRATAKDVPQIPVLLPGHSAQVSLLVRGIRPAVREQARVRISPLVSPTDTAIPVAAPQVSHSFWAVPWTLLAIVLVLIAAAILLLRRRRNGRRRPSPPPGGGDGPNPSGGPTKPLGGSSHHAPKGRTRVPS